MTEELTALISRATCARCNGNGLLAHSYRDCHHGCEAPCGVHTRTGGTFLCPVCQGEGINPNWSNPCPA